MNTSNTVKTMIAAIGMRVEHQNVEDGGFIG
jgi:hypothetical protein